MNYPTARDEQAAYWYLRLHDADVTPQEIQEGLRWRRQCPENEAAFERIEAFWRAWPTASQQSLLAQIGAKRAWLTPARSVAATAAFVVAVVGAWALLSRQQHESPRSNEYTTAIGEVRTVDLSDGSEVVLGGATSIRTTFSEHARAVSLTRGEAFFRVMKDTTRPFVVAADEGSAQALGTAFDVHRGAEGTTVTVAEGVVEVRPPGSPDKPGIQLRPGEQVALAIGGSLGEPRHVNADEVTSWRTGRKVFIDETLAGVLVDLNRYSTTPISLAAPDAAAVRITGTVKMDGIKAWLQALEPIAHVRVVVNEQGMVLVAAPAKQ